MTKEGSDAPESPYHQVRGLARGLRVLEALNKVGEGSAAEIARHVGLPRPTVQRLLETLSASGYVWRPQLRDHYRLTARVHALSAGHRHTGWIEELATPLLLELAEQLVWPVNLSTFEDNAMVLRVNTHRDSPLSLVRAVPGTRVSVLGTAVGLVHLAFSTQEERYWMLQMQAGSLPPGTDLPAWHKHWEDRLESVREAGHAVSECVGEGGRSASLAVPIQVARADHGVLASLNVLWIRSALSTPSAIERFRQPLIDTAAEIGRRYEAAHPHGEPAGPPQPRMFIE